MKTQIMTGCVAAAAALALAGCGSGTKTDNAADSGTQKTTAASAAPATTTPPPTTTAPPATTPAAPAPTTSTPAAPVTSAPPQTQAPRPTRTSSHPVLGNRGDPRCHTAGLSAALTQIEGAAGSVYAKIELTNTTGRACRMYGYGGVGLVGAPSRQQRDPSAAPELLSLPAGGHAYSQVRWSDVPQNGDAQRGQCQPTPSALLVTPPDETTSLRVTWHGSSACNRGAILQGAYRVGT